MKTKICYFIVIALIGLLGCEKEEPKSPYYEAISCIELSSNTVYVDSVVQFKNCSDSANVTYKWAFGDGTTSTEKLATHTYRNYGIYTVTLKTFVNNIQTDSSTVDIKVIIGEKYFDLLKITKGFDFAECLDSSILVVGATLNDEEYKVFISKFDKKLNKKWVKYLDTGIMYIGSIERLSNGNFIIPGSLDNSNNNENFALTKIDSSGNTIWTKSYQQSNGYCEYAAESKDGGIIAIGANNDYSTTILKVDALGNFEWTKNFLSYDIVDSKNIVAVSDGYLFASRTIEDTLVLMKLDNHGELLWQSRESWQIKDSHVIYNVWTSKVIVNDSYIIVVNEGNGFVMLFDLNGNFVKRNNSDIGRNRFISKTTNNNFIIGGGDIFWERINLTGFNNSGEKDWSRSYGKRNTRCFPSYGYGTMVKPLLEGNLLFLGLSYKECMDSDDSSMLLIKINEEGAIQ